MSIRLREQWLNDYCKRVGARLAELLPAEIDTEAQIRLSCGFAPNQGRRSQSDSFLIPPSNSGDETAEIFVSPVLDDARDVAVEILPLLLQAWLGDWRGNIARAVAARLNADDLLAETGPLGRYPHAAVEVPERKTDGTRLVKTFCEQHAAEGNNYIARLSRKALLDGAPICPLHHVQLKIGE